MSLAGHPPRDSDGLPDGWPASAMQQSDDHGVGVRGNSDLQRFSISKEPLRALHGPGVTVPVHYMQIMMHHRHLYILHIIICAVYLHILHICTFRVYICVEAVYV